MQKRITIIGMPSAGKTTIGGELAKKIGYDFIDLDSMVEQVENMSLIEVMNTKGPEYFRNMEFNFLNNLSMEKSVVISPAGSIIFQKDALDWILKNSLVILLETSFEVLEKRLNEQPKAVAGLQERGLKSIWDERMPLYRKYASKVVTTKDKNPELIAEEIASFL